MDVHLHFKIKFNKYFSFVLRKLLFFERNSFPARFFPSKQALLQPPAAVFALTIGPHPHLSGAGTLR